MNLLYLSHINIARKTTKNTVSRVNKIIWRNYKDVHDFIAANKCHDGACLGYNIIITFAA